jgi:serine protease Do
LDGAVKAVIKTADETEYEIDSVIVSDKDWDIVKFSIKADNPKFNYLSFSKKKIEKGDKVYNISSPLGLEKTVSEGIISSLRDDKQHGDIVQITAPISPGSSGSPVLDEKGNVFAVATFVKRGGQNLNFGVQIDEKKLNYLTKSDFAKRNAKFNAKADFVILNIPSDKGSDIMLNAIEFGKSSTTLYLSYTHLDLWGGENYYIWCELNKKENGFTLENLDTKEEYYVTSSTLGIDKKHGTEINLATTVKFKVYLPAIKKELNHISIYGCGKDDQRWQFKDIDLDKYREIVNVDFDNYNRDYALAIMREGGLSDAQDILTELIDNNPDDVISLNTLGIISYVVDNNQNAHYYFTQAIESNPNDELAYVNRCFLNKYQKEYPAALTDINQAININPDQPDYLAYRAMLYMDMEDWTNAKADWDKVLATDDFKKDANAYLHRMAVNYQLGNFSLVCKDIYTAYNLTNDKDLEGKLQSLWNRCGCN